MIPTFRLNAPGGRRVAIEPVHEHDQAVHLWGHALTSTTCARLTPNGARALAAHLARCADLIDPPGPRPIPPTPTPAGA